MDTNDRIEVIKTVRAVGKALRRTGILLILLSLAAFSGNVLDSQAGDVIAAVALGLITAQGLIMIRYARGILRNPGRDR